MDSCPKELEPFIEAHKIQLKEQDYMNWLSNQYTLSAVSVAVEHCLAGKKARSKYIEKPIIQEIEEKQKSNKPLSEEEKKKQTERLFTSLRIMEANFNLNHKDGTE